MHTGNKNIEEILTILRSIGFKGGNLKRDIEVQLRLKMPFFTIGFQKMYGKEMMKYALHFFQDNNTCKLQSITATHRDSIEIEYGYTNGVDAQELDKDMSSVNWTEHFSNGAGLDIERQGPAIGSIIYRLGALVAAGEGYGLYLHQQLLYKHWPENIYLKYKDTKHIDFLACERTTTFNLDQWPQLTAGMAYLILSKRHERLLEDIIDLRLRDFQRAEIESMLMEHSRMMSPSFHIKGSYQEKVGLVEYDIPIIMLSDTYYVDDYHLKLTPHQNTGLPARTHVFGHMTELAAAVNMLCGRAALCRHIISDVNYSDTWTWLDLDNPDAEGKYPLVIGGSFGQHRIKALLDLLPVSPNSASTIDYDLCRGDLVYITLLSGKEILAKANPEKQTLDLFTPDMQPIPFNFYFDPGWKPEQKRRVAEIRPCDTSKKRKGRGI